MNRISKMNPSTRSILRTPLSAIFRKALGKKGVSSLPIVTTLPRVKMPADIKLRRNIEIPPLKTMKIILKYDAKEILGNDNFKIVFKLSEKFYADKFELLHRDAFDYFLKDFVVKNNMQNEIKGLWILEQKIEFGMKYCQDIFLMNLDSLEGYLPPRYYNK